MSDLALNILVRPLIAAGFFVLAAAIAWVLYRVIPNGRIKVALFRVREPGDWALFIGWWLSAIVLIGALLYFDPLRR